MRALRWGIMGTGGIAATMARTLRDLGSEIAAVGSARPGAAAAFAAEWEIPVAVESHDDVATVASVDIVHVATTNDRHRDNVLAALAAGKPVLCEKPLALNHRQASEMLETARAGGTLVMEAMWMAFLPFLTTVHELIEAGTVGDLTHVDASFGFPAGTDPDRRWLNPTLGGGALLDLGVYPLTLAHHVLGAPERFEAAARLGPTGVDVDTRVVAHHGARAASTVTATFEADLGNEAIVAGREGRIRIHAPFHHSPLVTVERRGATVSRHDTSYAGHGFRFEIAETERCIRSGLIESPRHPHATTLAVLAWMDDIRRRCGVTYPGDAE